MLYDHLVVPDSIHPKARFGDTTPGDAPQKLIFPPIDLNPALLVVRDSKPLIAPIARRHSIAVSAARGRRVKADLLRDGPAIAQPERGDVALQIEAVGPARREQVPPRPGQRAHVAAVHGVVLRDPRRDQRVRVVRVHGHVRHRVDDVLAEPVARLHERVQVLA